MRVVCVLKADSQIGTGHLMRVKGLLPYFSDAELLLCTDSLSPDLYSLCSEYRQIFKASKQALLPLTLSLKPDLVLVDHYYLGAEFEGPLYEVSTVAVIDDLFGPRQHRCQLLIDQSPLRRREEYAPFVNADCELLIGASYSLVKPCFAQSRKAVLPERPTVLINFGGADPTHSCLTTARTVRHAGLEQDFDFVILTGQVNPDFDKISAEFGQTPHFEVIRHTERMDLLLCRCHLAIGACGGSYLERICAGVPSLNVEICDNQRGANCLFERYPVGLAGTLETLESEQALSAALRELAQAAPTFIRAGQQLLDGRGLQRIAAKIRARMG